MIDKCGWYWAHIRSENVEGRPRHWVLIGGKELGWGSEEFEGAN